ncbi:MAG: NUDIX domain-containing protein [Deltaproteobacteria bacterium]|nr:NUDIX domain-containing protein [Deltaproteobacteria bacterium]
MNEQEEIYAVVDKDDRVIGKATRREIHQKGLLHRSVHIFVFNRAGQLYIQKRSMNKDMHPGCWDSSASGHVDFGETYETAAVRELEEELGIRSRVVFWFKIRACEETGWEHVAFFTSHASGEIKANPDEIMEGKFMDIPRLSMWMTHTPKIFAPGFLLVFKLAMGRGILTR